MSQPSKSAKYWVVFGALLLLTVVTVAVANLKVGMTVAIAIALLVASLKGSLVASVFMHLNNEHKWIYFVLILTVIFFIFLLFIPNMVASSDYRLN